MVAYQKRLLKSLAQKDRLVKNNFTAKSMEYVEHTSKVLYNLVRANSSKRALTIRLSVIFAHFVTHD